MELFTQGNKAVKETVGLLISDRVKFGPGGVAKKEEVNCEDIRLFVVKYDVGGFREAIRKRILLKKDASLKEAKDGYLSHIVSQNDIICDENFYRFENSDLSMPLWKFSSNCNLNISVIGKDQWIHFDPKNPKVLPDQSSMNS